MPYTKVFNKPYAGGYKDRPDLSTPETAANLNAKDNALEHIEEYLLNQKISDLQNDSEFVTGNDVSEAIRGKADKITTYTKTEVDELVPDNKEVLEDLSDSEGKLAYKGEVIGGGGNANERELTYAEYQALSEEEQMNGTNYFVKDYPSGSGGGGGSSKHEYSTEEKVVGTWIDGKPIYEIVIDYGERIAYTSLGNQPKSDTNPLNIDTLIFCDAEWLQDSLGHRGVLSAGGIDGKGVYISSSNGFICGVGNRFSTRYIIMQYTKTTD